MTEEITHSIDKCLSTAKLKKMETSEIIKFLAKAANVITERYLASSEEDIYVTMQEILARDIYENPGDIRKPIPVSQSLIAIPAKPKPPRNSSGRQASGSSVSALIHLPGMEPYWSWDEDSPTFVASENFYLRTKRSVTIHKIIPSMRVIFYHKTFDAGDDIGRRTQIDVNEVNYGAEGEVIFKPLPEGEGIVKMPMSGGAAGGDF